MHAVGVEVLAQCRQSLMKEILVAIKAGSRLSHQLHGFVVVSDKRNATHDQGTKNLLECLPGLVGGSAQYKCGRIS
jgi:hypothetical protein